VYNTVEEFIIQLFLKVKFFIPKFMKIDGLQISFIVV
jgi:hypothetical protein